jgi:hypothetical protein
MICRDIDIKDNIKIDIIEIWYEGMDGFIWLRIGCNYLPANTVIKLRVS